MPRRAMCLTILTALLAGSAHAENWPGWRGPRGDGSSLETGVPTQWNGKTGEAVLWKTEIPGTGHSSPVVWENRVFVATCLNDSQERTLLCLNRLTGGVLWQTTVISAPLEKKHNLNSYASGTPATDGKLVYVTFLQADFGSDKDRTPGEMVVAAYDLEGTQKWLVKPGRFASTHGYCSSPVLFEDLVIVNGDHDGESYIVALNKDNGQIVWKTPRDHKTRSYVTPIIREIDGRMQMLLSGSKAVSSYDPRTGKRHWQMPGPTEQFVASLVYDGKLAYLTAGFPEHHVLAFKPTGQGDVDDSIIVWRTKKNCSYVPSPILCGDYFLVASDEGIGTCYLAQTGDVQWTQRLGKHYSASLVTAGGLVYFTADDGITKVIRPGPKFEQLAENELGEYSYASPAISQGQVFVRGEKHLFCIGGK